MAFIMCLLWGCNNFFSDCKSKSNSSLALLYYVKKGTVCTPIISVSISNFEVGSIPLLWFFREGVRGWVKFKLRTTEAYIFNIHFQKGPRTATLILEPVFEYKGIHAQSIASVILIPIYREKNLLTKSRKKTRLKCLNSAIRYLPKVGMTENYWHSSAVRSSKLPTTQAFFKNQPIQIF